MLKDIRYFITLSRPLNVLISLLSFAVAAFIANNKSLDFLDDLPFWATAITIVLIAATGYWINDVYDFRIDRINKPKRTIVNAYLSVKKVLTYYFILNVAVLLFSLAILTWQFGYVQITLVNILSMVLLFFYATYLKRVSVAGNLLISFLIALVIILAGYLYQINVALIWAIVFAFQITLIREITKDVEDIKGDLAYNLRTLPIRVGIRRTKWILLVLYILFLISCSMPFLVHYFRYQEWLFMYMILSVLLVQFPCLWIIRTMMQASQPKDFGQQSNLLKILMLTGILTLFFL